MSYPILEGHVAMDETITKLMWDSSKRFKKNFLYHVSQWTATPPNVAPKHREKRELVEEKGAFLEAATWREIPEEGGNLMVLRWFLSSPGSPATSKEHRLLLPLSWFLYSACKKTSRNIMLAPLYDFVPAKQKLAGSAFGIRRFGCELSSIPLNSWYETFSFSYTYSLLGSYSIGSYYLIFFCCSHYVALELTIWFFWLLTV